MAWRIFYGRKCSQRPYHSPLLVSGLKRWSAHVFGSRGLMAAISQMQYANR